MRLLNVHDLTLSEFSAGKIPKYAITWHRWVEAEEALTDDIRKGLDLSKSGHRKLKKFAEYIERNIKGIDWIWHDTCCIDKSSSQELTKAINSMFRWYLHAEVCLAYLHDVPNSKDLERFSVSTWFKRGWTLQELLAPHLVVFLAEDWHIIGYKGSEGRGKSGSPLRVGPSLTPRISAVTQIPESVLNNYAESQRFDPRAKLQWAKNRETTVEEDMVYCLLGICDITMCILYSEGVDKARKRLLRELAENGNVLNADDLAVGVTRGTSHAAPAALHVAVRRTYLPFERNRHFVGRSKELEMLERKLLIERDCRKLAIVGQCGAGKTQTALSFAYSVMNKRPDYSVFWLSALSIETFEQTFHEIAQSCNIRRASGSKDDIKLLVKRHLSSPTPGSWTGQSSARLFTQSAKGLTVFTTRDLEIAQSLVGSVVLAIERMAQKEAIDLLVKSLDKKDAASDATATAELLEELDCQPLAITQAAAYMNINKSSVPQYAIVIHGMEQDSVDIISTKIRDGIPYKQAANAVATTCIVSFKQIEERDVVAADLLGYMSCIEWKAIPVSILPHLGSQARMASALGRLCSYSFPTRRRAKRMYDMHQLVYLAIQMRTSRNQKEDKIRLNAVRTISKVFPSHDYSNCQIWRDLIPHIARIYKDRQYNNVIGDSGLFFVIGRCLRMDGRNREAVLWLERSCDLRQNLAEQHQLRLASQNALANAYRANGQVKDAVKLHEHVVRILKETLAEDHPYRLISQNALANAYRANGQVKDAVKLLEHITRIYEETKAEDHPDRLASQHALARAYQADEDSRLDTLPTRSAPVS